MLSTATPEGASSERERVRIHVSQMIALCFCMVYGSFDRVFKKASLCVTIHACKRLLFLNDLFTHAPRSCPKTIIQHFRVHARCFVVLRDTGQIAIGDCSF